MGNNALDLIFYSFALCGILMAIILVVSQYIILAQKSKMYDFIVTKEEDRDTKIDLIIKLIKKGDDED